ncbi:MAG: HemK2/MTQ2 family protein methyltransferase [Candidatus Methanomethylophilaceae archaeon]
MKYRPELDIEERDDVYPPSEDSILLIESLNISVGERILEIGCGSGIVSIHCALNGGEVTAVDINPSAVEVTRKNAETNDVRMTVKRSDLFENVEGRFDTIVFNLPYLPVDDEGMLERSWSGGPDGIGPLPELLREAPFYLTEKGRIVIVTSSLMDHERLSSLLSVYNVRKDGELPLFFERLDVLEITR